MRHSTRIDMQVMRKLIYMYSYQSINVLVQINTSKVSYMIINTFYYISVSGAYLQVQILKEIANVYTALFNWFILCLTNYFRSPLLSLSWLLWLLLFLLLVSIGYIVIASSITVICIINISVYVIDYVVNKF